MENKTKTVWNIDQTHSEINFKVKHMMISTVTGGFEKFEGKVETTKDNFKEAQFSFSADINSVNTKSNDRDNHLRTADFFDVEKYPNLTFISKSFDGNEMVGDLTIKGITKEITLSAEYNGTAVDPYGQTKAGFELEGQINRKDYGLTWNAVTEAGSIVVSDKVKIIASLQFIKK